MLIGKGKVFDNLICAKVYGNCQFFGDSVLCVFREAVRASHSECLFLSLSETAEIGLTLLLTCRLHVGRKTGVGRVRRRLGMSQTQRKKESKKVFISTL